MKKDGMEILRIECDSCSQHEDIEIVPPTLFNLGVMAVETICNSCRAGER